MCKFRKIDIILGGKYNNIVKILAGGGIILNIFNLASFIEIINENSISKAAANLHMTQSALSQQLKAIENDLNCQLVERSNRGGLSLQRQEILSLDIRKYF